MSTISGSCIATLDEETAAEDDGMKYILHPRSEIDDRVERLQARMGDLTGVLIFGAVNMCYFSGTCQDGLVYIPRDSEPIVMMRRSLERAASESPLDVRPLKGMKNLRSDLGISPGAKIGLEFDVLPHNMYARVEQALGDASFVDLSEPIRQVRSIKSDFEIGLIRGAAKMLDAGISSVAEYLKEGMREVDVACRLESSMRSMGHQGLLRFRRFNSLVPLGHVMSGPEAAYPSFLASPTGGRGTSLLFPQGAGFRRIGRNEPIFIDSVGVYNGYIADATRIFSIGSLSRELEDAFAASLDVLDAITEEMRPGTNGRELFDISESTAERLGYRDFLGGPRGAKCGFVGHGVGMELDEYPVIGPLDHGIEKNMAIAIEPKMIYPDRGVMGIEDTFLVTDGKPERLTRLAQEIWRV